MRVVHVEEDALAAVGGVELSDVVERARGKEGGSGGSGGVGVEKRGVGGGGVEEGGLR